MLSVGAAMLGLSALAACGGSDGKPAADKPAVEKKVESCSPVDFTYPMANASKLGLIVVDGDCRTVYRFDGDTASPPESNCAGKCEQMWTPVPEFVGS